VLRFVERPDVELALLRRQPLLGDRAKVLALESFSALRWIWSDILGGCGFAG
jgi:hypothetical protein